MSFMKLQTILQNDLKIMNKNIVVFNKVTLWHNGDI